MTISYAEDQAIKAWLTADQQSVQFTLNTTKQSDIGSWILFLDCGLEGGNKKGLGGLDNVDFKIEGGQLYRFLEGETQRWRNEGSIQQEVKTNLLLNHFPMPPFILDRQVLRWRCVTFPHEQASPRFLPKKGPGQLAAPRRSPLSSMHKAKGLQKSMITASTMVSGYKDLPWQTVDEMTQWEALPIKLHQVNSLNDPFKESLWWPLHSGSLTELCQLERSTASKFTPIQRRPIVFTSVQHEDTELVKWLNEVRLWSCNDNNLPCAFLVNTPSEVPTQASTVILPWTSPITQSTERIKTHREQLPKRCFVYMDHFFEMNPAERKSSWQAWMKLKLMPLLPPDLSYPSLGHEMIAQLVWFKTLLQHNKSWQPLPMTIYQKHFKRSLHFSPETYLPLLSDELLRHLPPS